MPQLIDQNDQVDMLNYPEDRKSRSLEVIFLKPEPENKLILVKNSAEFGGNSFGVQDA